MNISEGKHRLDWVNPKNWGKWIFMLASISGLLFWAMKYTTSQTDDILTNNDDVILEIDHNAPYAKTRDLISLVLDAKDSGLSTSECEVFISETPDKIITATADIKETVLYIERLSQRKDWKWFMVSRIADTNLDGKPNKIRALIIAQNSQVWFELKTDIQSEDGWFIDLVPWTPEYHTALSHQIEVTSTMLEKTQIGWLADVCIK